MDPDDAPSPLAGIPLFDGLDDDQLARAERLLRPVTVASDTVLVAEGAYEPDFLVITEGEAVVETEPLRHGADPPATSVELASVHSGEFVGEMALLHHSPASATVRSVTPLAGLLCLADDFDTLRSLPGVEERLEAVATHRLAANWARAFPPVPVELPDGTNLLLRPIRPDDLDRLADFASRLSSNSLRLRFLSASEPSVATLRYFIDIDQRSHFAWVAVDADGQAEPIVAVGRYIRLRSNPDRAEFALAVADEFQHRGIGTLLLGALGEVAALNGVSTFEAHVLWENTAMRAILNRRGAEVANEEAGVLRALTDVPGLADTPLADSDAAASIRTELRSSYRRAVGAPEKHPHES